MNIDVRDSRCLQSDVPRLFNSYEWHAIVGRLKFELIPMTHNPPDPLDGQQAVWAPSEEESAIRLSVPATIILERRMISRSFWSLPSWYLHTVAVGESLVTADALGNITGVGAGRSDKGELFVWTGFKVTLSIGRRGAGTRCSH